MLRCHVHASAQDVLVGLVTYSHVVRLHELGCAHAMSSEVVSGRRPPSPADVARIAAHESHAPLPGGEFLVPAHVLLAHDSVASALAATCRRGDDTSGVAVG